VIKKKWH